MMINILPSRRVRHRPFASILSSMLFVLIAVMLSGCSRSMREDGSKVAKAGSATAGQMAEFYESLQKDTVDTYELNAFREAYVLQKKYDDAVKKGENPPKPSFEMTPTDEIYKEYQQTYQALAARIRLARAIQEAHNSYAHLAEYNATEEVLNSVGGLSKAVNAASSFALPDPTGTVNTVVQGLFKDIITELTTIQQNRKLLRESKRLKPLLQKVQQIFDAEMLLYGGDGVVKDSQGQERKHSGIAGRKANAYKAVARELVEGDAVISTALVNRVLSRFELRWPEPQAAFSQPALKAGIIKLINARAYPLAQLTENAGDSLSRSLGNLITLHEQLAVRKPLTLQEVINNSAAAQVALDQLKAKEVPVDFFAELLKAIQKGAQP